MVKAEYKLCLFYQGDFGPFSPGLPTVVPLWMACSLKQRQKCRILPPDWMDVGMIVLHYGQCLP